MGFLDKLKGWDGNAMGGHPGTIDDDDWRELQRKAQRHAPPLGSREATERRHKASDQYRNREQN